MRGSPDFRNRTRFRKIAYNKFTALLLFLVLIGISRAAWGMYEKSTEAKEKRGQTLTELRSLSEREGNLRADIERLTSERGIEEEIRSRYMVAKDGENVIIVRDPEGERSSQTIVVPFTEQSFREKFLGAVGLGGE